VRVIGRCLGYTQQAVPDSIYAVAITLALAATNAVTAAPLSYDSRTDNAVLNSAPPGSSGGASLAGLLGAGTIYNDPQYIASGNTQGNAVIRLTDGETFEAGGGAPAYSSFVTPSGSENNIWNSNTSMLMIAAGQSRLLYSWNAATMTATRMDSANHGPGVLHDKNGVALGSEVYFSYTAPDTFFTARGTGFYQWVIDTSQPVWNSNAITGTLLADANSAECLNGILGPQYVTGNFGTSVDQTFASHAPKVRGAVVFNYSVQDSAYYAVVFDSSLGGCRWYNTLTGEIGGAFGSSTGTTQLATFPVMPAPSTPPVVTDAIGGSLTAGHQYKVAYTYVAGGETTVSALTLHTLGTGMHALTIAAPAQPGSVTPQLAAAYNVYICDATASSSCTPHLQSAYAAPASLTCAAVTTGTGTSTYWVVASFAGGNSLPSPACRVANGKSGVNDQNNRLSWTAVAGATGYIIFKDSLETQLGSSSVSGTTSSYTDAGVYYDFSPVAISPMTASTTVTSLATASPTPPIVNQGGFTMHNIRLDKSGTWAKITVSAGDAGVPMLMLWNVATNTVVPAGEAAETTPVGVVGGVYNHQVTGWGTLYASTDSSADFVEYVIESPAANMNASMVHMVDYPYYYTGSAMDSYLSYNNGGSGNSQPIIGSTEPINQFGPMATPLVNEIIGIPRNRSSGNKVYRFCHDWSSGDSPNFWAAARGNVSQDGKWFAFTSDMQVNNQGYGVGSSAGAQTCTTANGNTNCRTDVYICQLQ